MKIRTFTYCLLVLAVCACNSGSNYQGTVDAELATGIRNDSLFLGLSLGMAEKDFFTVCWDLNKKGLTKEGFSNMTVQYKLEDLQAEGYYDFYPFFENGKIKSMTGFTHYKAWSPWRKDLWSDHLIEDCRGVFEKWFPGNSFFSIKSPTYGKAYVKIDGNRRIVLYIDDDQKVNVLISDLTNLDEILKPKDQK